MAQRNKPGAITIADGGWWEWTRLHLDDDGITVRNHLRTYWIGWHEVRWFTDGWVLGQEGSRYWALSIVLHDGCVVTAAGTSRRTWDARPATLAAIRQTAERHAVPAVLTGKPVELGVPDSPGLYRDPGDKPGLREWTGTEWSPFLHVEPISSGSEGDNGPARVWSPLPELEQQRQWDDVAARSRRAGIWLAVLLPLTAGAVAVGLASYVHDPHKLGDDFWYAYTVAFFGLFLTAKAAVSRHRLKKADQAGKAARLADTRDSTGGPPRTPACADPASGAPAEARRSAPRPRRGCARDW